MNPTDQILGVGWDVGGWAGRKQAVAVARCAATGIEWLGHPRLFDIAMLDQQGGTPLDLIRFAWPDAPADTFQQFRVTIAIDAPLGFPLAFHRLLKGEYWELPAPPREIENSLAYRLTEQHIHDKFGKKPLSAPFDKLGNNATVAISHVRRWVTQHGFCALPLQADGDTQHSIVEVYPALVKGSVGECAACFARLLPTDLLPRTDEYDAAICALLGLAYGSRGSCSKLPPLIGPPDTYDPTVISQEGWIYYVPPDWLENAP